MNIFDKLAKLILDDYDFTVRMNHREIEKDLKEILRNHDAPIDGKAHFIIKGKNTKHWRAYFLDELTPLVVYQFSEDRPSLIVEELFALRWSDEDYYGIPIPTTPRLIKTVPQVRLYREKYKVVLKWIDENVKDGKIIEK